MTARPTDLSKLLRGRDGFVFILFALGLVVLLGLVGLAVDTARGYVNKAQISKAADAAALAGAKNVRGGLDGAAAVAKAISAVNGVEPDGEEGLAVSIAQNDASETAVLVEASRRVETTFMRVLGIDVMNVSAAAEATVPPIDVVLVLDQSGSMDCSSAKKKAGLCALKTDPWPQLKSAAKRFVGKFGDDVDQLALVHFSTMAATAFPLQGNFTRKAQKRIDAMKPSGDTNAEEALTFGLAELTGPKSRPAALKVLVFFTDGRPSAFRQEDGEDMDGEDGILTATSSKYGDIVFGWYRGPDQRPRDIRPDDPWQPASRCYAVASCATGGTTWTRKEVLETAREEALERAETIRKQGVFIYSIGLGNPTAKSPEDQPDEKLLEDIANARGKQAGTVGGYFFADKPEDLDAAFQAVSADILARLSQ